MGGAGQALWLAAQGGTREVFGEARAVGRVDRLRGACTSRLQDLSRGNGNFWRVLTNGSCGLHVK